MRVKTSREGALLCSTSRLVTYHCDGEHGDRSNGATGTRRGVEDMTATLMTTMTQPAPDWLRELYAARAHYEELFGWPVSVHVGQRQLVVALGQTLDAITMPAELAVRVQSQLGIAMLSGPVVAHPDGDRWTFLTQGATTMPGNIVEGLGDHEVKHAATGAYTVVPTDCGDG